MEFWVKFAKFWPGVIIGAFLAEFGRGTLGPVSFGVSGEWF
jgi:hypothetical protein